MEYWECDKCGRKVALSVAECPHCRPQKPPVTETAGSSNNSIPKAPTAIVAPIPAAGGQSQTSRVVVTDFDMPFLSMVAFIMKWALASIPALIGLFLILAVFGVALKAILPF
jgi:hypothetical protein